SPRGLRLTNWPCSTPDRGVWERRVPQECAALCRLSLGCRVPACRSCRRTAVDGSREPVPDPSIGNGRKVAAQQKKGCRRVASAALFGRPNHCPLPS
ncbi:hypothetical protein, partial [Calditerricola satsumensis]|uniref:hypothetical protein n=1 Tax=Calditerricola satsumensis TaxID=373054 RepID=UPI001C468290